jgi:ABC-type sugar transport system substrate-binding protein
MTRSTASPSRYFRRLRRTGAAATGVLLLIIMGACKSGDSDASQADDASISACKSATAESLKKAQEEPPVNVPTEAPDLAKIEGEEIYFISPAQSVPFILNQSNGFKAAAEDAGLVPVIFDGAGNVDQWNAGVTEAVSQGAAAIVLPSVPPALVSGPLEAAEAAGIPVVSVNNGKPDAPLEHGVDANLAPDLVSNGAVQADQGLQLGGCNGGTYGVFFSQTYPSMVVVKDSIVAEIEKQCPACEVKLQDVLTADLATKVGPFTQTMLQQNPDMKAFLPTTDAIALGMVPALEQVSSEVPIIGSNATEPNLEFVANGQNEVATMIWSSPELLGYATVDQVARLAAGQPAVQEDYPSKLVTADSLEDPEDPWPELEERVTAYQDLWSQGQG